MSVKSSARERGLIPLSSVIGPIPSIHFDSIPLLSTILFFSAESFSSYFMSLIRAGENNRARRSSVTAQRGSLQLFSLSVIVDVVQSLSSSFTLSA